VNIPFLKRIIPLGALFAALVMLVAYTALDATAVETDETVYLPIVTISEEYVCTDFFTDDFSNPDSGWPTQDNSIALIDYRDGEYRMQARSYSLLLSLAPSNAYQNYDTASDMRWATTVTDGVYGLVFGATPSTSDPSVLLDYYTFLVFVDREEYRLLYFDRVNDTREVIIDYTKANPIRQDGSANRLKIERDGSTITGYINSIEIFTRNHGNTNTPTHVGLIQAPFSPDTGNDARFDNFIVDSCGYNNSSAATTSGTTQETAITIPVDARQLWD
jgi:hypothetical protein